MVYADLQSNDIFLFKLFLKVKTPKAWIQTQVLAEKENCQKQFQPLLA